MAENNELIDPVHGHGSQCLINLLLTGRGVSYVWDNDQDLGGLSESTNCLITNTLMLVIGDIFYILPT